MVRYSKIFFLCTFVSFLFLFSKLKESSFPFLRFSGERPKSAPHTVCLCLVPSTSEGRLGLVSANWGPEGDSPVAD